MMVQSLGWMMILAGLGQAPASQPAAIGEREGVPAIEWRDAGKYLDQQVIVQGRIASTRNLGNICFLNFDDSPDKAFAAVIRQQNFAQFAERPETAYRGKNVRIFGRISEYRGKLQIMVFSPEQIEVVAELSPPPATSPSPSSAGSAASRPATLENGRLKVATFNIENLFDAYDDPYHDDEGTPAKPREELQRVADTIRRINADVVGLQEIESRDYLERFVRAMLPDMGYEVVQFESNDPRGIDCAVLSRVPVGPVTSYRHVRFKNEKGEIVRFERDLIRVRIEPPGLPAFDLLVLHLKSKGSGPSSDVLRLAEAKAVRRVADDVLARDPQARFIICGDFNDLWASPSLQAIRGSGPGELRAFFEDIPAANRITYNQEPYREMIDFIIASPALAAGYVPGSYGLIEGSPATTGADHNPVFAIFGLK